MENLDKPTTTNPVEYNRIDTHTKTQAINLLAEGKPQNEIANILNIDQSTVSRLRNKPENKILIDILKETLRKKYATRFIARKVKEERKASELSNYALNPKDSTNDTLYQDVEQIEKYLDRQDKSGLKILPGTGIFPSQALISHTQNLQINQEIRPEVLKLILPALSAKIQEVDEK